MPDQTVLPRWRGFNLLGLFSSHWPGDWEEEDFRWIAELGFDFVRLPMSYRFWVEDDDPFRIAESGLGKIDRGVELARSHGLHVCLNLHRAPGYCVNRGQREPFNLWQDPRGLEAFCLHWATLSARYRHLPGAELSFNLVNEPRAPSDDMSRDDHERVVRAACKAIRDVDPDRPILADGLRWGNDPCPELAGLGIAQSCRAYVPGAISHYKADWTPRPAWEQPVWPGMDDGGQTWDRPALEAHYERWAALARGGVGVHWAAPTRSRPPPSCSPGCATCSTSSPATASATRCGTSAAPSASSTPAATTSPTRTSTAISSTARCSSCCVSSDRRPAQAA